MNKSELLANAKPILFNTQMVRAILDNRKTFTRRVVKFPIYIREDENNLFTLFEDDGGYSCNWTIESLIANSYLKKPYRVGDILYVRETWRQHSAVNSCGCIYKANYVGELTEKSVKWRPSIHMPKEVSRIFLRVTDVRVERLQDIAEVQAYQEGFNSRQDFITTILKIYPDCTEQSYVWVYEFERIKADVDK